MDVPAMVIQQVAGRGFKIRHPFPAFMTTLPDLNGPQAQEIEEQLFTTHRQQLQRHMPIPLPRQDFWIMVRALLSHLDMEIQAMVRKGSIDMRLQNLQRRQTNIRRIASELARKRMVAMMQHLASQSLRGATNPTSTQELPALDWQRHDPSEKALYHALQLNLDRFKKEIDWQGMQQGLLGEVQSKTVLHAPGTMQLDAYLSDGQLSQRAPPDLAFEETLAPLPDDDMDEEDRLLAETTWLDEEAYLLADMADAPTVSDPPAPAPASPSGGRKHGAAMELAPSTKARSIIEDNPPLEQASSSKEAESGASENQTSAIESREESTERIRVRILESLPEPILDEHGEAMSLEAGDIHFLDEATATWLVEAGVAERADL